MYQNGFYSYPGSNSFAYSNAMRGVNNAMGMSSLASTAGKGNMFSRLASSASKFSFSGFLNTTQKTLGVVNQAIPIFYQVKPIWNNAKTMFRVMGALKEEDTGAKSTTNTQSSTQSNTQSVTNQNIKREASTTPITPLQPENTPQFFL